MDNRMKKRNILWAIVIIGISVGVLAIVLLSRVTPLPAEPPAYSLSPGPIGMIGINTGYVFDYDYGGRSIGDVLPAEEILIPIQRFLDQRGDGDLVVARLREFRWAYQAEIVERSTGRHAFGLMVGKSAGQISPKAGPNMFWNTAYGSQIAEMGGGYGMLGRLISLESSSEMPLSDSKARNLAIEALKRYDDSLKLNDEIDTFYGFYEFYFIRDGELVGEVDVNGYSGQVWLKEWGEPQIDVLQLL